MVKRRRPIGQPRQRSANRLLSLDNYAEQLRAGNAHICRVECGFVNLMWDLGSGPHFVMDTALEAGLSVLCGEEDPLAE
jgi:hypothetical protein